MAGAYDLAWSADRKARHAEQNKRLSIIWSEDMDAVIHKEYAKPKFERAGWYRVAEIIGVHQSTLAKRRKALGYPTRLK